MPKLICTNCADQLQNWCNFHYACGLNNQRLHHILNNESEDGITEDAIIEILDDDLEEPKYEFLIDPFDEDPIVEPAADDILQVAMNDIHDESGSDHIMETDDSQGDTGLAHLNFECKVCRKSFVDQAKLNEHSIRHNQICKSLKLEPLEFFDEDTNERRYQCGNCMSDFAGTKGLTRHLKMHPCRCPDINCCEGGTKSGQVDLCECIDITMIALSSQQESIKFQKHICSNCFRVYNRSCDLRRHLKTHPCVCAKRSFPVESNAAKCCKFEILVTEDNAYQCANCDQEFDLVASVIEHLKQHDCVCGDIDNCQMPEPDQQYKYKCPNCPKTYTFEKQVVNHQAVHRGDCGHVIKDPLEIKDELTGGIFFFRNIEILRSLKL